MTILLVGGGSAGHITPLLAVAHDLKKRSAKSKLIYIGEKGGEFKSLAHSNEYIDEARSIHAGKLRRYANQSFFVRLFDIKTHLLNIVDIFKFSLGVFEALHIVIASRPGVVFIKGGFVGVPVGIACRILKVPYVTHDSDVIPGLANRLIARSASKHAVAMPVDIYPYPAEKTVFTGVPVVGHYNKITADHQKALKKSLSVPTNCFLVFITGGSQGAVKLNAIVTKILPDLLKIDQKVYVIHQTGKGKAVTYEGISNKEKKRVKQEEFIANMHDVTGAADIIVSRAGASTIAELAIQAKACILVPSPHLAGDHQTKNAQYLHNIRAAILLKQEDIEKQPELLVQQIDVFLRSEHTKQEYQANIEKLASKNATKKISDLLISQMN